MTVYKSVERNLKARSDVDSLTAATVVLCWAVDVLHMAVDMRAQQL